ncbi:MAG: PASTA domain-containing protein [Lachnospiraceae bacterium]|nr:PASTA domain-containing protein [Lachnospiraceae bacterium]
MRLCMGCMEEFNEKYDRCPYCDYVPGTPALEAYHIVPGLVLHGKYIVGRSIGYGGFGVTYIGFDQLLNKKVAIKEYLPGEFSTRVPGQTEVSVFSGEKEDQFQKGVTKFVDEAKRLAKFQRLENIVEIYDAFQENGTAYIVMEYLEGETLKSKLKRDGKMSVEEALKMIIPIANALEEVHKAGIVHRDIAPDNIFITKSGEVKLLDFGAARNATVGRSRSLSVIVKMGYAPPEQYQSRGEQGSWTDVYALAATFYRAITGIDPEDSMAREVKDTIKLPSKVGVNISSGVENALMNALHLSVHDRTQTMGAFVQELRKDDTKRTKATKKANDNGRWTWPMKLGVGSAAAAIIAVAILLATGVIGNVGVLNGNGELSYDTVPDLTGVDYDEAVITIEDMGMTMKQAAYSYSDTMAENTILTQSIAQGTRVEKDEVMEVIVSLGKERRLLKDIIGFETTDVESILDGFYYETLEEESELAKGTIVSVKDDDDNDINLSEEIGIGNPIKVVISTGMDYPSDTTVSVPDLSNKSFDEARDLVKQNNLYIKKTEMQTSETVPEGSVISQSVEAGSQVESGSVVEVVVSSGEKQKVTIANVLDKSEEDAIKALEEQGFVVNVSYEESSLIAKGNVIRTNPQVGESVEEGSEIELVVSSGSARNNNTTQSQNNTRSNTTEKATEKKKSTKKATETKKTEAPTTEKATTEAPIDIEATEE